MTTTFEFNHSMINDSRANTQFVKGRNDLFVHSYSLNPKKERKD
jgi:hypothetical protein